MVFPDVKQLEKELVELEAMEMEKIREMMENDEREDEEVGVNVVFFFSSMMN